MGDHCNICNRCNSHMDNVKLGVIKMKARHRRKLRAKDREWFKKHTSWGFMYGKQIHHDWKRNDRRCVVLSPEVHKALERVIRERDTGRI